MLRAKSHERARANEGDNSDVAVGVPSNNMQSKGKLNATVALTVPVLERFVVSNQTLVITRNPCQ
jgi:hypothetical protein